MDGKPVINSVQRKIINGESVRQALRGSTQQIALQRVYPGVVGTHDIAGTKLAVGLGTERRAAVPTGVVKPALLTLDFAHQ